MATGTITDVVMPQMGVSVSEGTVTKWLKHVGDAIEHDEPLLEISTDKVDTEVPSPGSGVLTEVLVEEGTTVPVGTLLARIGPAGEGKGDAAPAPHAEEQEPEREAESEPEPVAEEPAPPATQAAVDADEAPLSPPSHDAEGVVEDDGAAQDGHDHAFVSPVVARIAAEQGIDPTNVPGTGRGGRVTKKDILAYLENGSAATAPPAEQPAPLEPAVEAPAAAQPPAPAVEQPAPPAPAAPLAPAAPAEVGAGESEEPFTPMRRGIADHMRRSLDTSAHVTTAFEIDMSRITALRTELKPDFAERGVNLTYLAFIARATVDTLEHWPWLNGEIRGDRIITRNFVNLGFAVALEGGKGLIVPVVRNAETLNLLGMAKAIIDIADRARTKKLLPDDVQGGTFTITNPGGWGAIFGTPIISQPQVGILDTEAIVKRPWVVQDDQGNDVIAVRPIMNLCLSYDHRLVDGAYAAQFMKELREKLENWDRSDY